MLPRFPQRTRHRFPVGRTRAGFSLVELLVATVLLLTILGMLVTMVNMTTYLWNSTTGGVKDFQRARQAFDILTGRLSQATLNTYWGYRYDDKGNPLEYVRLSELRFLSDQAASLTNASVTVNPGQGVFFQAPGGVCTSGTVGLPGTLNTWGYFIEYGSDSDYLPGFFADENTGIKERFRFRLVEIMEPKDKLSIYGHTSGVGNLDYTGRDWIADVLAEPKWKRIIAENVVALVLLPKLSPTETGGQLLAPKYSYDSSSATAGDALVNSKNQLPPLVEVSMLVVDEHSVARHSWTSTPPDLGLGSLFSDALKQKEDLDTLEAKLRAEGLQPQRFTITVPIRGAKWSTNQSK